MKLFPTYNSKRREHTWEDPYVVCSESAKNHQSCSSTWWPWRLSCNGFINWMSSNGPLLCDRPINWFPLKLFCNSLTKWLSSQAFHLMWTAMTLLKTASSAWASAHHWWWTSIIRTEIIRHLSSPPAVLWCWVGPAAMSGHMGRWAVTAVLLSSLLYDKLPDPTSVSVTLSCLSIQRGGVNVTIWSLYFCKLMHPVVKFSRENVEPVHEYLWPIPLASCLSKRVRGTL